MLNEVKHLGVSRTYQYMQEYYVYILSNHNNTVLYTGITNNLRRRINEHKRGSSSFARKYRLYKLLWYDRFNDPVEAIRIEKKIKGWRKSKKINLIKTQNAQFIDLNTKYKHALLDPSTSSG